MTSPVVMATSAWRSLARPVDPPKRWTGVSALWHAAQGVVARRTRTGRGYMARAREVEARGAAFERMTDADLDAALDRTRSAERRGRVDRGARVDGLAAIVECAARQLGMRAHRNQIACALGLLDGRIVELATGEGKTLAIAMAACVMGWRGRGVHVMTANDYLAARDAADMGPAFARAGVSVGVIAAGTGREDRREAYARDVVYSTAREVAADLLRDELVGDAPRTVAGLIAAGFVGEVEDAGARVMRGTVNAIVDEADALIVDEATTPLVLADAGDAGIDRESILRADAAARELVRGRDYTVEGRTQSVMLTARGRARVDEMPSDAGRMWASGRAREELVEVAVHAREVLRRDEQYVVLDGKVCIVDAHTGRLLPDRTWRAGVHQAVEAKEGLAVTPVRDTVARIAFQRFFGGYGRLSGTTGTAREVRREVWSVYRAGEVHVPEHRRCVRVVERPAPFATTGAMVDRVVEDVARWAAEGRPVLVGTRSVEMSERVSARLAERGIAHEVLNAVRHEAEARIVSRAGERGAVTIATNMAGRGTDIRLGEGVAELGGLVVVSVEAQPTGRLERQLIGRCARQGDPGLAVVAVSMEDEVVRRFGGWAARVLARGPALARRAIVRWAQGASEREARRVRARVARDEDRAREALEFAGAER